MPLLLSSAGSRTVQITRFDNEVPQHKSLLVQKFPQILIAILEGVSEPPHYDAGRLTLPPEPANHHSMIVLQRSHVEGSGLLSADGLGDSKDTGKRRIMRNFLQEGRLADRL